MRSLADARRDASAAPRASIRSAHTIPSTANTPPQAAIVNHVDGRRTMDKDRPATPELEPRTGRHQLPRSPDSPCNPGAGSGRPRPPETTAATYGDVIAVAGCG